MEKQFTPFQIDIFNDIVFFTNRDGYYGYTKSGTAKLYDLDVEQVDSEVNELISLGLITSEHSKKLVNNKYITINKLRPV